MRRFDKRAWLCMLMLPVLLNGCGIADPDQPGNETPAPDPTSSPVPFTPLSLGSEINFDVTTDGSWYSFTTTSGGTYYLNLDTNRIYDAKLYTSPECSDTSEVSLAFHTVSLGASPATLAANTTYYLKIMDEPFDNLGFNVSGCLYGPDEIAGLSTYAQGTMASPMEISSGVRTLIHTGAHLWDNCSYYSFENPGKPSVQIMVTTDTPGIVAAWSVCSEITWDSGFLDAGMPYSAEHGFTVNLSRSGTYYLRVYVISNTSQDGAVDHNILITFP